jgi:sugar phosphate isomerase/epimerase
VTIGLSLPLEYLTGKNDSAGAKCLSDALGKPRDCLANLKGNGVTSIELQGFGPDISPDEFLCAVERILGSGMHLTLHGCLTDDTARLRSCESHSKLLAVADLLEKQQAEIIMVVHALACPGASYRSMVDATTRALERLTEDIRTHDLPVIISLEIERHHGVESPGTTYDGLLDISQRLGSSELGFCWDMGHTCSSVSQKKLASVPPAEFTAKVNHTHVHNLSPEGDTHWPLTDSCPDLASGISRLEARGYTGIYNLELYPTRWVAQQDAKDGMLRSVICLRKILNQFRCRGQSTSHQSIEQPLNPSVDWTRCRPELY